MKTAEEYLSPIWAKPLVDKSSIIEAMKEYAKQVTEQALSDAAQRATYIRFGKSVSINPDSITNTQIQLP